MELEHLGTAGVKAEKGNPRLYKIALAICVCMCAVLLLALIVGKSTTTTTTTYTNYKTNFTLKTAIAVCKELLGADCGDTHSPPKMIVAYMQRRLGGGSAGLYEWFVAELGLAIFGSYKVSKTLARTEPDSPQVLLNCAGVMGAPTSAGVIIAIRHDAKQ